MVQLSLYKHPPRHMLSYLPGVTKIDLHSYFSRALLRLVRWRRKLEMLWTRLQMDVRKTLLLDVMALKAHQNDCSYVHEVSGSTFKFANLAW